MSTIVVSPQDVGSLLGTNPSNYSSADMKNAALGVAVGTGIGYLLSNGKLLPMTVGAALGFLGAGVLPIFK